MTRKLAPEARPRLQDRNKAARGFAEELRRSAGAQGLNWQDLGRLTAISPKEISMYACGMRLPSLEKATRLAERLGNVELVRWLRKARTKTCLLATCRTRFFTEAQQRHYCSPACQAVAAKRVAGVWQDYRASRAERALLEAETELREFREAAADFCHGCEPEGLCRTPKCPLRVLSPLPLQTSDLRRAS